MLDPRRFRIAGLATLGAVLVAGVLAKGCSSGPKPPAPPATAKAPAAAPGAKPATTAAKPGAKPTEVATAPKPAATAPAPVQAKPAPAPAPKAEPKPAVQPEAKKPEVKKPEVKKEEPKPAPSNEFPPAPPVAVPESSPRVEAPQKEVSYEEAQRAAQTQPKTGQPTGLVVPGPDGKAAPVVVLTTEQKAALEDEKTLKALSEEKRIELEKMKYLSHEYTVRGEEAYAALRHQEAKDWALKALEQDSSYRPAMDLLNKARLALGERAGDIGDLSRELSESRRVKMEMNAEKARGYYEAGKANMAKSNFEGAVQSFDDCLTVIQSDPFGVSWGDLKGNAESGLRDAKAARERSADEARRKAAEEAYKKVKSEELQRQIAEQRKFDSLMNDAYAAYDREDYGMAEDLAGQANAMRPTDSRSRNLQTSAARSRHGQSTAETRLLEKEQFRRWKLEMEETTIPYSKVLQGPSQEHWAQITRLRKDLGQVTGTTEENPETAALKNRLAGENTSFAFDGQTLSEAVTYLNARHGINIVIDDQVKADADAQPLPPFKLTNISLKDAIELLLKNTANLTYRVRGNVVFITRPELAREPPVIRIHPIGDLTMKINNFVPPDLVLKPAGAEADEAHPKFGKMEEGQPTYGSGDDLVALIKDNVGDSPEVWNAEGVGIEAHGDANLLVVAEPALQEGVARFLSDLRKFSGLVVNIEARFLSVSDNFLRDVGVDVRGLGGNKGKNATVDDVTNGLEDSASAGLDNGGVGLPSNASGKPSAGAFYNLSATGAEGDLRARTEHIFDSSLAKTLTNTGGAVLQWTLLGDTQLSAIWRAVEKKQEGRVLQSPNLTVYNTQRANITLINQLAFVQDFDVEVAQTAFIADPQIGILQDGLDLDVKPIVSNDRRYVTLQLQPTVATLKRPIQTFSTSLGSFTTPITLELPEIAIQKAQTTVRVPNGGTLLIGGLKNISSNDMKSETPFLSKIPIVSFFFSRRASSQEFSNLLIVIRARITDLAEEETHWASTGGR